MVRMTVSPLRELLAGLFLVWGMAVDTLPGHAAGGDPQKGEALYRKNCVLCHGAQGKGDGQFGQTVNPPAADFTSPRSKSKSEAELLATIEYGRPPTAMEGWKGQLSEQDIRDVLEYVLTLRH